MVGLILQSSSLQRQAGYLVLQLTSLQFKRPKIILPYEFCQHNDKCKVTSMRCTVVRF
jgi:hypothetical protein